MADLDITKQDLDFIDIRLPEDVERGMRGGPEFRTNVTPLDSGREQRNIVFEQPRNKWNVTYGIMAIENDDTRERCIEDIKSFFYIVQGKALGFRFKDWSDFCLFRQSIGNETTTEPLQIYKRYDFGSYFYDRNLTRVVTDDSEALPKVWLTGVDNSGDPIPDVSIAFVSKVDGDGRPVDELDTVVTSPCFTIEHGTGMLSLHNISPRTPGTPIRQVEIECEFDVPVRFDNDNLDIETEHAAGMGAASIPSLSIIELKE